MSCACGAAFTVPQALSCPVRGYQSLRHNELRDLTATMITSAAHDISIEPRLQPLSGENFHHRTAIREDGARLDVAANGVWGGRFERAFFDIRVFNPHARSNSVHSIPAAYAKHERERGGIMRSVFTRWSMPPSFPSYSVPPEAKARRQLPFTSCSD